MSEIKIPLDPNEIPAVPDSPRKRQICEISDQLADEQHKWYERNRSYHDEDIKYLKFLIPEQSSVLELGCGTGRLLGALQPSLGVGIDISPKMITRAQENFPQYSFITGDIEDENVLNQVEGTFDYIVLSDTIGYLDDSEAIFSHLHRFCTQDTRLILAYYNWAWEPILRVAQSLKLQMPHVEYNWMNTDDIMNLMRLGDFDPIKREWRQLVPRNLLGLGSLINRYVASLPILRRLCLRNYIVARSMRCISTEPLSVSVVVPCRNEAGNIEAAVQRTPRFSPDMELIYVEGNSQDNTYEECLRVQEAYPDWDIKVMKQKGHGKGDAVHQAFDCARGDVLMILDADLTVPPEDLPKFYHALITGKGEYINGTRFVYPMEQQAMRFLNFWANRFFSILFTWLLNQRFTDTLCGTKVLRRVHYNRIISNRSYFGYFDPFGDFDLIFGATKLNLKSIDVPIRYAARRYGETQISRFSHGWLLIKMVFFAFRKLKAL